MMRRVRSRPRVRAALVAAVLTASLELVSPTKAEEARPVQIEGAELSTPTAAPATPDAVQPFLPAESSPLDGLKISGQSWRRGGLGSKALITFTLRNTNDFAVKDIGIACAFTRRDGSHLTDRKRVIAETVKMKSRKTFARVHIGFVNVNADKARCTLVTASRV